MNTEKKLSGRPHKKEEDKLIGRRVSIEVEHWDIIDEFLSEQGASLKDLLRLNAAAILTSKIRRGEP